MVKELSATNSRKDKEAILLKHACCVKIHLYVNNPFWQVKNIRSSRSIVNQTFSTMFLLPE